MAPPLEIPFHRMHRSGKELSYLTEAVASEQHSGDGPFTKRCQTLIEERLGVARALLTTSCTTGLEMAAILARGEYAASAPLEVIVPAFTFVSTTNAFLLHGFTPVFADIREDTCNLDESAVEQHISEHTRAIVPVHYAGVPCEMEVLQQVAKKHNLLLIEDAAQALFSTYHGRPAGALGDMACFSFHGTKNLSCGEGGAISFRDLDVADRAEILWQKGTNRKAFLRGEIDRYTWVDLGGSYLPSDLLAAYLLAQLEAEAQVHQARAKRYRQYMEGLADLEREGRISLPRVPAGVESNHHLFHIVLAEEGRRPALIRHLREDGIGSAFHYGALHLTPMGARFGQKAGSLPVTERVAENLLRLPLYPDLTASETDRVIASVTRFFGA